MAYPDIRAFHDYRRYLQACAADPDSSRGWQQRLAAHLGCNRAFVSQVIHARNHLSAEQGFRVAGFLRLDAGETAYFTDMIAFARAKQSDYREFLAAKLKQARQHRHQKAMARDSLAEDALKNTVDRTVYYSAWHWSAIHVLISIERYQRVPVIAKRLHLPVDYVEDCLDTLLDQGLVEKRGDRWHPTGQHLHAPRGSVFAKLHHTNWRQRAMLAIQQEKPEAVYYTSVYSLSAADVAGLSQLINTFINKTRKLVDKSVPEEELVVLNVDMFPV